MFETPLKPVELIVQFNLRTFNQPASVSSEPIDIPSKPTVRSQALQATPRTTKLNSAHTCKPSQTQERAFNNFLSSRSWEETQKHAITGLWHSTSMSIHLPLQPIHLPIPPLHRGCHSKWMAVTRMMRVYPLSTKAPLKMGLQNTKLA